jgi:predicted acylesterase/phospholipase RssA
MKNIKLLDGSGASTKIEAVYKAMKVIIVNKAYTPDIISGVSASALLGIPIAMRKWNILDKELSNFNLDTIFSEKPVNEKGKPTLKALKNVITGKPYLGKMGSLEELYRRIVTPYDFEIYKNSDQYADVYVSSIDYKTGSRNVMNLKKLDDYEEMIKNVMASASIPIFVESVKLNDKILFDGGVRDHSIGYWVLRNIPGITHCVSIFSRPKDSKLDQEWEEKNVLSVAERTIEIQNIEISKTDEQQQRDYSELKGIKLTQLFLPSLTKSMYDVNRDTLSKLTQIAINIAQKAKIEM